MKSLRIARKARPRAAGRDNGHVIVIIGLGNTSDLVDMIVVSPLAEVIEEVRQRRVRCQRRHLVVNDEAPSGDYWRRSGSHPELRYTMTCHQAKLRGSFITLLSISYLRKTIYDVEIFIQWRY